MADEITLRIVVLVIYVHLTLIISLIGRWKWVPSQWDIFRLDYKPQMTIIHKNTRELAILIVHLAHG
jgi:hypothetical protein